LELGLPELGTSLNKLLKNLLPSSLLMKLMPLDDPEEEIILPEVMTKEKIL
jgi:hypothetical protein